MSLTKKFGYKALDWCTFGRGVRRVICGEVVYFPARWCRWYASTYEPSTFSFLRAHCLPGATAFDIGSHFGLFTVAMAKLAGPQGHVVSFEPTPLSREVLTETVRLNGCEDMVYVRPEAIGAAVGTATFFDTGNAASNANSLVRTARSRSGLTVPVTDLDSFCETHDLWPQCLKIDAEGAELEVLRGAQQVFQRCRPHVALSLHPGTFSDPKRTLRDIWNLLSQYDMTVDLLEDYDQSNHGKISMSVEWFCSRDNMFDVVVFPRVTN